jgi:hypothetical protein
LQEAGEVNPDSGRQRCVAGPRGATRFEERHFRWRIMVVSIKQKI